MNARPVIAATDHRVPFLRFARLLAQVTIATGFDVDYYLDQVGADYYLTAGGEPPDRETAHPAAAYT